MGLAVTVIFLVISGLAYSISAGFATNSAIRVTKIPGYKNNPKLTTAHKYLTIAAVVAWLSITFIVIGIVLTLIFSPEIFAASVEVDAVAPQATSSLGKYALYGLLFLIMAGVITVGILSAIAAADINNAKVQDDDKAARQATIVAAIAIPVFVLILIIVIAIFTYKPKKKTSDKDLLAELSAGDSLGGGLGAGDGFGGDYTDI